MSLRVRAHRKLCEVLAGSLAKWRCLLVLSRATAKAALLLLEIMESDGTMNYQIGELANLVEMSPRTIRYYEEIGLLDSIKRVERTKRVYMDQDFQRLKFIKRLKHLGLTLLEMLELEDIYQIHRTNKGGSKCLF